MCKQCFDIGIDIDIDKLAGMLVTKWVHYSVLCQLTHYEQKWLQIQLSQGSLKGIHKPLTISAYFYQLHDNEKMKSRMLYVFMFPDWTN